MNSAARPPIHKSRWLILGSFVVLAFVLSGGLLAVQPATGIDPSALSLVQFGPALAAFVVWLIWRGTISGLLPKPVPRRQAVAHTVLMVAACVVLGLIVALCAVVAGTGFVGAVASGGVPFAGFLVLQLIGAAGEEIGWRGQMQPLLESGTGRLAAVLITGVGWALWHIQAFSAGPVVAVAFLVATVSFAVLLGYLGNGSFWQRVLTASIGHWLINIGLYVVMGDSTLDEPQVLFVAIGGVVTTALFMTLFALRLARISKASASPTAQ